MTRAEIAASVAKEITIAMSDKIAMEAQAKLKTLSEHTTSFYEAIYDAALEKLKD